MKQRDIYLVSFPFSDLRGNKVRPAVVVSRDSFNKTSSDVIMCAVTGTGSRLSCKLSSSDLVDGKLHKICYVNPDSIVRLQKNLLQKRIGKISEPLATSIKNRIVALL